MGVGPSSKTNATLAFERGVRLYFHQLTTAERFKHRPGIFVAVTEADLAMAIDQALETPEHSGAEKLPEFAPSDFTDRLRRAILQ